MFPAWFRRWLYREGRPNFLARMMNRGWAIIHSSGIGPDAWITLEVKGYRSGRTISFPLAMVTWNGGRYLVSMLGKDASWVRNVRAADGRATLRHGRRQRVRLEEVRGEECAPILKAYLKIAPGARAHIPVDKDAPVEAFEKVAGEFPVFRVRAANP